MSECTYKDTCANLNKSCFKCFNYSMFAERKERVGLRPRSLRNKQKKQGIDFENRGTQKYNNAVRAGRDAARRQIASGALSFALGDMITEEELTASIAEFKERGSRTSRGAKQITIQKKWLDDLKEEAKVMNKEYYYLPFSFKDSDTDYVAMEYNILLSYVQTIQALIESNKDLKERLNVYRSD